MIYKLQIYKDYSKLYSSLEKAVTEFKEAYESDCYSSILLTEWEDKKGQYVFKRYLLEKKAESSEISILTDIKETVEKVFQSGNLKTEEGVSTWEIKKRTEN